MKHILVFGDSNTWGYDASTYLPELGSGQRMAWDERWPGRVQTLLGDGYRIIENALNARTNMVEDPYFPNRLGLKSLQVALDATRPWIWWFSRWAATNSSICSISLRA